MPSFAELCPRERFAFCTFLKIALAITEALFAPVELSHSALLPVLIPIEIFAVYNPNALFVSPKRFVTLTSIPPCVMGLFPVLLSVHPLDAVIFVPPGVTEEKDTNDGPTTKEINSWYVKFAVLF